MAEQIEVLKDIRKWLRFLGMSEIDESLKEVLNTQNKREVYDAADGTNSLRDIENDTGVSNSTVGSWLRSWEKLGIVHKNGKGRYEHLISLSAVSIGDVDE